jgi:RecA/RadA recombinase
MICGGYGSGKTEVAVNLAVRLRETGRAVKVADLDIVNPYFRTREARRQLRALGIDVLMPSETLVYADLPVVQPEVRGEMERGSSVLILDLGGDAAGARLLASLAPKVPDSEYAGCLVLNARRPATSTVAGSVAMIDSVRAASGARITHLVANTHLGDETSPKIIEEGVALVTAVREEIGLDVAFVAVERRLVGDFDVGSCPYPVMVMDRMMLKPWEVSNWLGSRRLTTEE